MEQNVGKNDKIVRVILALVLLFLGYVYSWVWYVVAVLLLFTVFTGFCYPYKLLGINTAKSKKK